jgi:hypothetical protein
MNNTRKTNMSFSAAFPELHPLATELLDQTEEELMQAVDDVLNLSVIVGCNTDEMRELIKSVVDKSEPSVSKRVAKCSN